MTSIGVAYLLALPVAWDRERDARSAGLRTFPLVAIGACGFTLIGIDVFPGADAQARVVQGLLAGIGFIGGGAIIKSGGNVTGTATAASIWATAAVGIAVAYDRFEIALILSFLTFFTLGFFGRLKRHMGHGHQLTGVDSE